MKRRARWTFFPKSLPLLTLVSVLVPTTVALAQVPDPLRREADELFKEGKRLLDAKRYAEACGKLEASQKLDRALGTLLNLADCYEKQGRTASAYASFAEAAKWAKEKGQEPREKVARERMAVLVQRLSQVLVQVAPEAASQKGLELKRNGVGMVRASWGVSAPLDPGEYQLEARAPGCRAWTKKVTVAPGPSLMTVEVPKLEPELALPPPPQLVVAEKGAPGVTPSTSPEVEVVQRRGPSTKRVLAYSSAGLGVASVAATIGLAMAAKSHYGSGREQCHDGNICSAEGVELIRKAQTEAGVATVTTVVGAAALAASGVLLWLSWNDGGAPAAAPKATRLQVAPYVDGHSIGFALGGAIP
ncbi:MAG: tetratricopeptide repeat protein [Deltaproteobacteria bacterium]|nr:tetratricopeptide repeat protein [Deltaproteobacteria bacterium]